MIKNLPAKKETQFGPWIWKIPWGKKWQPTPVFWPGIPWIDEPGGLQSMGLQTVGHEIGAEVCIIISKVVNLLKN